MKLFVGLGNPGEKYQNTRHNIGFMAIDQIVTELGYSSEWKKKFESEFVKLRIHNENILFVKPQTYMNHSGYSVRKWMDYYDIPATEIYVYYDEMDIPFNKMKLKIGGSAGGHNGIKSLIDHIGAQDFNRVRLGIGRPPRDVMVDFVLSKFSKKELAELDEVTFPKCRELFDDCFQKSFRDLMAKYNQKEKNKE